MKETCGGRSVKSSWIRHGLRRKEWKGSEGEKEYMRSESGKVALARALISKSIADEPKNGSAATLHTTRLKMVTILLDHRRRDLSRIDATEVAERKPSLMSHRPSNVRPQRMALKNKYG